MLCIELLMGKSIEISSFLEQRIGAPRVTSHQQSQYVKTEENISTGLFGKLLERVAISFKMSHACTATLSAPKPAAVHCRSMPLPKTPGHSQASLGQSLVGSLLLSPGSWCAEGFVCALQESVSPALWKFCNQIPLAFKSNSMEFSVLLPHPQVGKSVVGTRTCVTVQELLWYNCSSVCGSSAWWLYSGADGNLLQEGLCHTLCLPGLL